MVTERPSVLLWGAGQHGAVVAEYARAAGWSVLGFVDANESKHGSLVDVFGARVVLSEHELLSCIAHEHALPHGVQYIIPAVGDNEVRWRQVRALGAFLASPLIHPSAVISPTARIGRGSVVCPLCFVNREARVGAGVIVNSGSVVGHNTVVEDAAHVGARVALTGGVRVGARTPVGAGAVLVPGVHVGSDAKVGAGAVVLHDVGNGVTAVGVPARPLERQREKRTEADTAVTAALVEL
jgi:sugar O-acyltransferase (sialic acid O-acetyltransferase NeuD family)